jgi:hypothetical protein
MMQASGSLRDAYRFAGFIPGRHVEPHPADVLGWVLELHRRAKRGSVGRVDDGAVGRTIAGGPSCGIWSVEGAGSTSVSS